VPSTTWDNVLCAAEAAKQQRGKYPRSEHNCKLCERRWTGHIRSPEFLPITTTRKIGRLYEKITVGMAKTPRMDLPRALPRLRWSSPHFCRSVEEMRLQSGRRGYYSTWVDCYRSRLGLSVQFSFTGSNRRLYKLLAMGSRYSTPGFHSNRSRDFSSPRSLLRVSPLARASWVQSLVPSLNPR
jgi:hypothetical protein